MAERIGFIGLGKMGLAIASNVHSAGYELTVYNRTHQKAESLVAHGAHLAHQSSEVITPGGIVISMVSNDAALEHIVLGDGAFLQRLGPGGIHISMSTIAPATARRLAEAHARHGSTYLGSPVFGRPEAAAARKLWICLSGQAEAKARVQPLLQHIGQGVFDLGEDPGAANVVKLCGNFLIASALEAMSEALALAEKNHLDRSEVINVFGQTLFGCIIYQNYGKMIAERRYNTDPAGFQMTLGLKDVNLVLDSAEEAKVPMPLASLVHDRFLAGIARGRGEKDWSAIAQVSSEEAGLEE